MLPTADIMPWAKPSEFENGKVIKFINFEKLSIEEMTMRDGRPPMYPPASGFVYRFTFKQVGYDKERRMDINSIGFKNDLAGRIKHEGEIGKLQRSINGTNKYGKPVYKWTWETIQEDGFKTTNNGEEGSNSGRNFGTGEFDSAVSADALPY